MELSDILQKLKRISDRMKELSGEATTLNAKLDSKLINPILYQMKFDCIDFEKMLIEDEMLEIEAEVQVKILMGEINE